MDVKDACKIGQRLVADYYQTMGYQTKANIIKTGNANLEVIKDNKVIRLVNIKTAVIPNTAEELSQVEINNLKTEAKKMEAEAYHVKVILNPEGFLSRRFDIVKL